MESRIAQRNRQIRWRSEIRGKMNERPKSPADALNTYRIGRILLRSFCSWPVCVCVCVYMYVYICVFVMKSKEVGRSSVVEPGRE